VKGEARYSGIISRIHFTATPDLGAEVWPSPEVVLTESPMHLSQTFRPELGLALIDLK
jgi:hypothetical protein